MCFYSYGALPFVYSNPSDVLMLRGSFLILEDTTNQLRINEVITSDQFVQSEQKVPNLGVSNSTFWLKFQLRNMTDEEDLILELAYPIIDEIEFYTTTTQGQYTVQKMGENKPFQQRKYNHPNYLFNISIAKNETQTYFMKIVSKEQIMVPIQVGSSKAILEKSLSKDVLFGVYSGIILVMFLYNLFIYLTIRDKSYLYYVAHTLLVGITQACFHGYAFKYLWPNSPWIAGESVLLSTCLVSIAGIEFLKAFLRTRHFTPKLHKVLYGFTGTYFLCIFISLFGAHNIAYQLLQPVQACVAIYILWVAIAIARKGYRPAKFYLLAWSILMVGIFIFALKDFGILPYNNFTYYTLAAGSAIEVVLLSFALADKINILKKEKVESQEKALEALQENKRIITEQNITLETKVNARTKKLRRALKELKTTYSHLKQTQSQLVSAEKMASLGQLTAGIAHEMNNPINFVAANVNPLKNDIKDMLQLLSKYEKILDGNDIHIKLKEANDLKKEMNIDVLKDEINALLEGIDEGASRTTKIIKSLKIFSRLDEDDLKKANINECLDSTLMLLQNKIERKLKIIKEYGDIPEIECFSGKINQVFMNIINNAIQAISVKYNGSNKGFISIKTNRTNSSVMVYIKDNGIGMSNEVKEKIFEPFYTTKDIGEGIGLGLSIGYGIVEDHHGTIQVETEKGKGSEFVITLPIRQS